MKKGQFIILGIILLFSALLCVSCAPDEYIKISFETNGGTPVDSYTVRFNNVSGIEDRSTTKDFYVFDGWCCDEEGLITFDRNYYEKYKDIVVYAKWLPMFELMPDNTYCLINGYKNDYESFDIPREYNGKTVASIAQSAFYLSTIKTVSIPNTVNVIGDCAFDQCNNLESIVFQEGSVLKRLGSGALGACKKLTNVVLPEVTDWCGDEILALCESLKSVTFLNDVPKNINYPEPRKFFKNSDQIEEINIPEEMWEFDIDLTGTAWYRSQPDGIVYLGDIAYRYKGTPEASITVKEGTKYIGARFVKDQYKITEVILPSTIIGIGAYALANQFIKDIDLPDGLKYIGDFALGFGQMSQNLSDIPDTVEFVGNSVFRNCTQITTLPSVLLSAGDGAFGGCDGITSLPSGLRDIGHGAFANCTNITELPSGLESVGDYAFDGAIGITSVPVNLLSVGTGAFDHTAWYDAQPDGVLYYGKKAFSYKGDKNAVAEINLIEGTEVIGDDFFAGFKNVKITLPQTIKIIGKGAFAGSDLSSIKLPYGLLEIGERAFSYSQIREIDIPGTVKRIGIGAFNQCTKLTEVTLREGLQTIEDRAFYDTTIETVYLPKSVIHLGQEIFPASLTEMRIGFDYLPTSWYRENARVLKHAKIIIGKYTLG